MTDVDGRHVVSDVAENEARLNGGSHGPAD